MRRIDIFISSLEDVRIQRGLAERLVPSISAEFSVPVSVSYSNAAKRLKQEDAIIAQRWNVGQDNPLLLCPCFWEYQDLKAEEEYSEHIPNTGQATGRAFPGLSCADSLLYDNDLGYCPS